jgi:tetratricopeptide (TPR) repeat protein
MTNTHRIAITVGAIALGMWTVPAGGQEKKSERFDMVVRNDFFAGFAGDKEALGRAMKTSESILRENPNHSEALVWHGSALFAMSGESFQAGDMQKGQELWSKGLAEMDKAVELTPNHLGVRAPRGATLLTVSRFVPEEMKADLLTRAVADYQKMLELQKSRLDALAAHPKGELLMGLADGLDRSGQREKAMEYVRQVAMELTDTAYGKRARQWLDKGSLEPMQRNCIGCHVASK